MDTELKPGDRIEVAYRLNDGFEPVSWAPGTVSGYGHGDARWYVLIRIDGMRQLPRGPAPGTSLGVSLRKNHEERPVPVNSIRRISPTEQLLDFCEDGEPCGHID